MPWSQRTASRPQSWLRTQVRAAWRWASGIAAKRVMICGPEGRGGAAAGKVATAPGRGRGIARPVPVSPFRRRCPATHDLNGVGRQLVRPGENRPYLDSPTLLSQEAAPQGALRAEYIPSYIVNKAKNAPRFRVIPPNLAQTAAGPGREATPEGATGALRGLAPVGWGSGKPSGFPLRGRALPP
jgi:hypothetical protein